MRAGDSDSTPSSHLATGAAAVVALVLMGFLLTGCAGMAAREIGQAPGPDTGMFDLGYDVIEYLGGESLEWPGEDGSGQWAVWFDAGRLVAEHELTSDGNGARFNVQLNVSEGSEAVDPKGTVILLHSWRQTHQVMMPWAAEFSTAGFHTLVPDLRGHGHSGGAQLGFGVLEAVDVRRLIDVLEATGRLVEPLHIMGVSLGGSTALRVAEDPRVTSVIAIAPFNDPAQAVVDVARMIAPWRSRLLGQRNIVRGFDRAMNDAEVNPEAVNTADAIVGMRVPALFIHGEDDRHVPYEHSSELLSVTECGQLLVLPDTGGHIASHVRLEWIDDWILPFLAWAKSPPVDCRGGRS